MDAVTRDLKVVGRRQPASGAAAAEGILRLVRELREGQLFIPRGVYRFKSFEEAQEWSMKMMARRSNRERPRSTT
jgi:hypothetical protein